MKLLSMVLVLASGCASAADHPVPEAPAPIQSGAVATVGAPAPDFVLPGTDGKLGRLSDHAGRVVVLEWFNPDCPFVEYAHEKGPLKSLPTTWSEKGVVWLPINSNAPGKQGAGMARNARSVTDWTLPEPVLWDSSGAVG
ncbi:MAG: redoxin domain-containing protein, partial [Myxococcota bacterium]|nr:redoxin domain-containing protein [Myxococcota bacterium]